MRRAFSLIELVVVVVIVGILVAVAAARFSGQAERANRTRIDADVRVITDAVELYRAEHHGRTPAHGPGGAVDGNPANFAARLTGKTTEKGSISAAGIFGPYLREIPVNPYTSCPETPVGNWGSVTDCSWRFDPVKVRVRPDHSGVNLSEWP